MNTQTRTHAARLVARSLLAAALALLAFSTLPGCSSNSLAPDEGTEGDIGYHARTSPDSVMANLRLAYENRDLDPYMECLAADFVFYPSPGTLEELPWLPDSWGRDDEWYVHHDMFRDVYVMEIALELFQNGEPVELPGPDPGDPVMYEYTFGVDLRVNCPDSLQYVATAPSIFLLAVDPDDTGPGGVPLWEILHWYDLDDNTACGRPVLPTTWGELKAMYLPIDH